MVLIVHQHIQRVKNEISEVCQGCSQRFTTLVKAFFYFCNLLIYAIGTEKDKIKLNTELVPKTNVNKSWN